VYTSDISLPRFERTEPKKSAQDLIKKQEAIRIRNVEEKINSSEVEVLKLHDQENLPFSAIEQLCQVYSNSLNQLITENPQLKQLLSENEKRVTPYSNEFRSILRRIGDGFGQAVGLMKKHYESKFEEWDRKIRENDKSVAKMQMQLEEARLTLKNRPFVTHFPGEQLQLEMNNWVLF
jgi:predicted RNase H-like nuclease (RuvC/YqgF family)